MKKLILLCIAALAISACEGDRGPQGPPGFDGQDGLIGTTIEVNVNFPLENEVYVDFINYNIEVFESDAVLVYRSEQTEPSSSGPIFIWKQLPQTIYFNDSSELVYNFDHTFNNVRIFIEGNTNFDALDPNVYYNNQDFRIVIVPSDFANDPTNNIETFEALQQSIQKQGFQLKTISIEK